MLNLDLCTSPKFGVLLLLVEQFIVVSIAVIVQQLWLVCFLTLFCNSEWEIKKLYKVQIQ